jgi:hypothetical protein
MEDLARVILPEDADAGHFLTRGRATEIVVGRAIGHLVGHEADVEISIKVVAVRRHPRELPAHSLAETLDLGQRRARDGDEGDVAPRQVHNRSVGVVGHVGAVLAGLLPTRGEHQVLHQQLAAAVEQVGQRATAHRRVEFVGLVDPHPGQRSGRSGRRSGSAPSRAQAASFARQPLAPGYDAMILDARLGYGSRAGYVCCHHLGSFLQLSIGFSTLSVGHGKRWE